MSKATKAAIISAVALLEIGAGPTPAERVITGDGVVAATVNGAPARFRIDPGALAMPIVTAEVATRAKLKPGKLLAFGYVFHVGPTLVKGPTAVGGITLDGSSFSRRIAWNELHYQSGVDGVVGPGGLAEPVVRFQLRAPIAGERIATLPLVDEGGIIGSWGGSYAMVTVGAEPYRVRFAPHVTRSYVGAGSALRLATALGGRVEGAAEPVTIAFGIARPVRAMSVARPLVVGTLSLTRIGVRTAEGGGAAAIQEAGAATPEADPDEVVVTARSKHKPRPGIVVLGADVLARCSSITFDKPAKQVRLTCG